MTDQVSRVRTVVTSTCSEFVIFHSKNASSLNKSVIDDFVGAA